MNNIILFNKKIYNYIYMQINYYNKYIKYKKKYLSIKKKIMKGGMKNQYYINDPFNEDEDEYDDDEEKMTFDLNSMDYKGDEDEDEDEYENDIIPDIPNKFVISSHGAILNSPYINKIKVPQNCSIYFQQNYGNTCTLQSDKPIHICLNDTEFVGILTVLTFSGKNPSLGCKKCTSPLEKILKIL